MNNQPIPAQSSRRANAILDAVTHLNLYKPILPPKPSVPDVNSVSQVSLRVKYLLLTLLGEKIFSMFFQDPLKGRNIYAKQDFYLWIMQKIILIYLIVLYFTQSTPPPGQYLNIANPFLSEALTTLLIYYLVLLYLASSSYVFRVRINQEFDAKHEDVESFDEFCHSNAQYFNGYSASEKLEVKLLNQGSKLSEAFNQFGPTGFDLLKQRKDLRDDASVASIICWRWLLLSVYFAISKYSFTTTALGDDWYIYPLLIVIIFHNSIYSIRVWDAWLMSNSLSAILNKAIQSIGLNQFQEKLQKIFKDKEVYYDIFDIKTLTLITSLRDVIIFYNKTKWKIVMDLTSFFLGITIRMLLIWGVLYDLTTTSNSSIISFIVNPFTVMIIIDLIIMLGRLNPTIDHTSQSNLVPAEQEKFLREYKVLLSDLISYYEGKAQLHSDLYKDIAKFLEEKHGEKLLQHLHSLKFTVKLLLQDSLENPQMIPAIFGKALTKAVIIQIYVVIFIQLSSLLGSASHNASNNN